LPRTTDLPYRHWPRRPLALPPRPLRALGRAGLRLDRPRW
jgi:hypothetical protein